jgi:hypothetical protein
MVNIVLSIVWCNLKTLECEIAEGKTWLVFLVVQTILVVLCGTMVVTIGPVVMRMLRHHQLKRQLEQDPTELVLSLVKLAESVDSGEQLVSQQEEYATVLCVSKCVGGVDVAACQAFIADLTWCCAFFVFVGRGGADRAWCACRRGTMQSSNKRERGSGGEGWYRSVRKDECCV